LNFLQTYFQLIADFITHHPTLGIVVTFSLALGESIPVLGVVYPGTSVIMAVAMLAGLGYMPLWAVLVPAIAGAIVGDGVSYWFGHRYRSHALRMWPMSRYPRLVERSERFFALHGGKSILIARFTPVVRAFVPMIAGVSGMQPGRFYRANILSAFAWAFAHILPAAVLGASLSILNQISGRLVMVMAVILIGAVALSFAVRYAVRLALSGLVTAQVRLVRWLGPTRHPVARAIVRVLEPEGASIREVIVLGCIIGLSITLLLNLAHSVLSGGELARSDHAISGLVSSWRTIWGDRLMVFVTSLGDTVVTVSLSVVVAAWLAAKKYYRLSIGFIAAMALTFLFVLGLKGSIQVPRPSPIYTGIEAFSFPSGHTTHATALYGVLSYIWLRGLKAPWRVMAVAVSMLLISAIAFSRVYLQAHWPSDVVAGLAFGISVTAIFVLGFRQTRMDQLSPGKLLAIVAVTLLVVGGGHAWSRQQGDLGKYAHKPSEVGMTVAQWRKVGWQRLPAHRVDLGGDTEEPMVLQWAGDASQLAKALATHGWRVGKSINFLNGSYYVSGNTTIFELPILPRLHDGRAPILSLVHQAANGDGRLVLHVWRSKFRLEAPLKQQILVGALFAEQIRHPMGVFSFPSEIENAALDGAVILARQLPKADIRRIGPTHGATKVVLAGM
jgi:membrane protein DedA with SNARE-associated domain/membrane-associated phospholipid phosphatase